MNNLKLAVLTLFVITVLVGNPLQASSPTQEWQTIAMSISMEKKMLPTQHRHIDSFAKCSHQDITSFQHIFSTSLSDWHLGERGNTNVRYSMIRLAQSKGLRHHRHIVFHINHDIEKGGSPTKQ